jgi:hypothetical protein
MNCKNCRNDLFGFIRGTLSEREESRIREHLEGCAECRSFVDYLRTTLNVIQKEKIVTPDPFLSTRIEGILTEPIPLTHKLSIQTRLVPGLMMSFVILAGIASGIGLGTLISANVVNDPRSDDEFNILMNDLQQEPIETFIMGLDELPEK